MTEITLLPIPRKMKMTDQRTTLPDNIDIALNVANPAGLLFTAKRLQNALRTYAGVNADIRGGNFDEEIVLSIADATGHAQGYTLTVDDKIRITGDDEAGVFYGVCTLIQLLETYGAEIPAGEISDYPDFPNRGVMLDISRDKVYKTETLVELIDMLASWKINQVQLYTEHTFAYRNHRVVWEKASPMTAEEILEIDAFCKERFIELVPNQNSFGHMHRWFEHKPYISLAESETDMVSPWGSVLPPFSLSPAVPGSLALVRELFAELLPNFTSTQFNVGCDETFDLGQGRTKAWTDVKGKGRVYLDFLLNIYALCNEHGKTMQFWGDIINQYPELVPEVPKDTIALEWGYEANHDFPGKSKLFAESGIPFYVCPGTSSWNTIAGRTDNAVGNIKNAIANGLKYGAIGVLNTDWGDRGHWQPLPVSYLGFAHGAALSWAAEANDAIDLPAVLDAYAFRDKGGVMGKLAYDLGNAYDKPGITVHNGSLLFWMLQTSMEDYKDSYAYKYADEATKALLDNPGKLAEKLHATITYIDSVMSPLEEANMTRTDGELIQREFMTASRMIRHGANHALLQLGDSSVDKESLAATWNDIEADYRKNWLARNRPGGLDDSAGRFDVARKLYE
ncbi:MAG: glycoside hydrolase family 20 zincin-like fold domain-containing protein [Aggregatilineales bacterium]